MEIKLTLAQARWKNLFFEFVSNSKKPVSMQDFLLKNSKASRIDKASLEKIIFYLESEGLISFENRFSKSMHSRCIATGKTQEITKKESEEMTKTSEKTITEKSPEELEAMAQELLKLSEVKKKELASGDHIRKTLNPLILQVCQAKGKVLRLSEQQIDALDELEKAINNLKDALK
ncbi:TPA: hypothetical protein QB650_001465 [Pasteurella multocida]|uniref:hypothetical protein n=1 Tax=Pasteurella multocida TaxID=747 RepID=UPI0007ED17BA|nr:hypothetical protein [Pasteurella multocida]MCL7822649.1 hypothetical protein [Pasteurella multocida]MDY0577150.1 hypothetical protein [Pasteurella multocida]MEB3502308.1 hypothetical protein [Pasteurella multocida]OBP35871.1 hypothetical protein A0R74_02320 [Pasteurella multocida subsp. multocida]URH97374.1 hypothetical protein M8854_05530 [Pasteurella multocida]